MRPLQIYKNFFWGIFLLIFLAACSSSSYTKRYHKPEEKESSPKSSVRFTSKKNNKSSEAAEVSRNNLPAYNDEFDEEPIEDIEVDLNSFKSKYKFSENLSMALTPRERLLFEIISYLETPYAYGGDTRDGIDCSAFTQNALKKIGLNLGRTASEQFSDGLAVNDSDQLVFGDLVFFNTRSDSYPGHVGIYLGEDLFVHASRTNGVSVSSLKSTYYYQRYVGARRINSFSN